MLVASPVLANESQCASEYEQGRREMAAWAESAGIIEGVIYGHSLTLSRTNFCLVGSPKEKVQAIAAAFGGDAFRKRPVVLDDVPTKAQAQEFLVRFFSCK